MNRSVRFRFGPASTPSRRDHIANATDWRHDGVDRGPNLNFIVSENIRVTVRGFGYPINVYQKCACYMLQWHNFWAVDT